MFIGEVILAILAYPIILLAPGLLWTFLFKSINSRMGIIKRLLISAVISISSMPLFIFSMNRFLDVQINLFTVSIMLILITFFPLLISFVVAYLIPKPDIQKPVELLKEIKSFFFFIIQEVKKSITYRPHIILLLIITMGVLLTLFPHFGYALPIHTDEWHYMAYADNLIALESTELQMPYYGWNQSQHWEIGFIIFIAIMKMLSGVSWPFLFCTLPAVIFTLIIMTSYKLGQKYGFGLHSAFIVALAPSTLRFLGPVFLVPITLGIFLIMISIYLIIAHSNKIRYLPIFLILTFSFLMHPPTAGYLFIALFAVLLINIIQKQKNDSILLGLILIVFTFCVFFIPQSIMEGFTWSTLTSSSRFFLPMFSFIDFMALVSYVPVILALFGIGFLYKNKEKYSQSLISILALLVLFAISLYYLFPNFYNIQAVYDRAIILLAVMVALIGGAGLLLVQKNVSKPLFIVLLSCILILSLSSHANEPYYHIISENEYDDFVWIHDNLNSSYEKAILDPWKAVAFTPVTGKKVYYRIPQGPGEDMESKINSINAFFAGNCSDSEFLETNGISIIYTRGYCSNPDFVEIRDNIYIYQPAS